MILNKTVDFMHTIKQQGDNHIFGLYNINHGYRFHYLDQILKEMKNIMIFKSAHLLFDFRVDFDPCANFSVVSGDIVLCRLGSGFGNEVFLFLCGRLGGICDVVFGPNSFVSPFCKVFVCAVSCSIVSGAVYLSRFGSFPCSCGKSCFRFLCGSFGGFFIDVDDVVPGS